MPLKDSSVSFFMINLKKLNKDVVRIRPDLGMPLKPSRTPGIGIEKLGGLAYVRPQN
jgi:hypothetical protein